MIPFEVAEPKALRCAAENREIVAGTRYHAAKRGSRAWKSEQLVPWLVRAFDPARLAAEIERQTNAPDGKPEPARGKDRGGGEFYVEQLFALIRDEQTPATVRREVLERIRELTLRCAEALHEGMRKDLDRIW